MSTQPKQSGKYRNWINVYVFGDEKPSCVKWEDLELWKELPYPEQFLTLRTERYQEYWNKKYDE